MDKCSLVRERERQFSRFKRCLAFLICTVAAGVADYYDFEFELQRRAFKPTPIQPTPVIPSFVPVVRLSAAEQV